MLTKLNWQFVNKLRSKFFVGAAGSFILKITYTGLTFGTSLFLTRILGAAQFGVYVYAIAWINFLVIASTLGLDKLLIREMASFLEARDWGLIRGILKWTNWVGIITSGLIISIVYLVTMLIGTDSDTVIALRLALILLPILTLTRLRQGAMQGVYRVISGQLPEMIVQPILFLTLAGIIYWLLAPILSGMLVVGLHIIAAAFAFVLGSILLNWHLPVEVSQALAVYRGRLWLGSTLPLLFFSSLRVIDSRIDIIMLGFLDTTVSVAVYEVLVKGTQLIMFIFIAVNAVLAPTIANLSSKDQLNELQRVVTLATRTVFLLSLPIALIFIFFGNYYLALFGETYLQGRTALIIVSLAKLFGLSVGSVGFLLIMSGFERDATWAIGSGALINLLLNLLLIPRWGIDGAAIATSCGTVIAHTILCINVYRRLGIQSTIFGIVLKNRLSEVQAVGD